jgi:hypothetical protein
MVLARRHHTKPLYARLRALYDLLLAQFKLETIHLEAMAKYQ